MARLVCGMARLVCGTCTAVQVLYSLHNLTAELLTVPLPKQLLPDDNMIRAEVWGRYPA